MTFIDRPARNELSARRLIEGTAGAAFGVGVGLSCTALGHGAFQFLAPPPDLSEISLQLVHGHRLLLSLVGVFLSLLAEQVRHA